MQKNQSSDIEKTSQLAEKTGLSKESQPSKIHCISDSSEDDFEDPKKKKSEKCPQTSTPECGTPCKMEDDAELPILSRSKRIKRKISSPGQSPIKNDSFEELPDLAVPVMSEKEDDYMKDFTEMMQKKRERQLLAESTVIDFPSDKEGKQVSVVYQDHGGLGFTRPFKTSDTVKNVYSWIISEVDPEILPPVFHFECAAPTKCNNKTCPHIYELAADHLVTIDHLPDVLYLREGCFAVNDTFTGLGDVLI
ncbi:uncharacterized protein LOC133176219 [Saccostrea echinata]|uniref:uncharacterized protein LOC133176219 n=1 Tax=Saccostrea echinata TaxID=191078 RepID=UPI002A83FDB4|nr:uncharacterized protein LOC133176219 [Saccostrea echinata]